MPRIDAAFNVTVVAIMIAFHGHVMAQPPGHPENGERFVVPFPPGRACGGTVDKLAAYINKYRGKWGTVIRAIDIKNE